MPHTHTLGRASATPTIDVFITLLSLGSSGYKKLCMERKVHGPSIENASARIDSILFVCLFVCLQENFKYLKEKLEEIGKKHEERVLSTPQNPISIG